MPYLLRCCLFYVTFGWFWVSSVFALDTVSLAVKRIAADDWVLHDVALTVLDMDKGDPQVSLSSARLRLPRPFNDFTALNIRCKQFHWYENYLNCSQGQGRLVSNKLNSPAFDFSFQVQDQQGTININRLSVFGGKVDVYAREKAGEWHVKIQAKAINIAKLTRWLPLQALETMTGQTDVEIELKGVADNLQQLLLSALFKKLSMQALQGKIATEGLLLRSRLSAHKKRFGWQWRNSNHILAGGLYIEPVYLEIDNKQTVTLTGKGFWQSERKKIKVEEVTFNHPHVILLQGDAKINYQTTDFKIESADVTASIPRLQTAAPVYLSPFLEASVFDGINLAGLLNARVSLKRNNITAITVDFNDLMIDDAEQRFQWDHANGQVNWTKLPENSQPSFIDWQRFKIKAIPFRSGRLDFVIGGQQFRSLKKVDLGVLGGVLSIKHFSFEAVKDDDAVHFEGEIKGLSLAQLSEALKWTPLDGKLSGYIPAVHYQNKKLELGGELRMQVFGGEVIIKKLASSGIFSDFSRFYTDIEFDNLDLNLITRKFQIGNIEGRLSGFAHNVYLENWYPVSFYAWLGTPEDDDSRHRISQKAVENIASIGGGGAADVISRGFLRFFDTFGYDKLGFGCYLHQGVCQMMGVEAADNGYYLIKGGGLPRIDVIGYNARLDWDVLIQRLSRVVASDEVVVE